MAARLHHILERYPVPKSLSGQHSGKISPIFRDVTELTAHHSLTDKIKDAVSQSEYLIVLCSPASKTSHWVRQEIKLFREIHGESSILCALIDGTPQTSFPPALLETGKEPLAANLSPKNFRLGVSQLAASILGVGLDELVQRDLKKLRRRVTLITASAISALLIMGTLTWTAMDARQLAEQRRVDAEELIEFMLTDLRDDLDAVGSLDALQAVGDEAAAYYDNYKLSDHDDDALGRRATVFQLLGKTQDSLGNYANADRYFHDAYLATEELLERDPDNPDRIFDHSQSAFWVGNLNNEAKDYKRAQIYFQIYFDMIQRLKISEGNTERFNKELGFTYTNLGSVALELGQIDEARQLYNDALSHKKMMARSSPEDIGLGLTLARAYNHLSDLHLKDENLLLAIDALKQSLATIDVIEARLSQSHAEVSYEKLRNLRILSRLNFYDNNMSDAKQNITSGIALIEDEIRLDPKNINIVYEDIRLRYMAFELAFLEGNTELAKEIHNVIQTKFNGYPKNSKDDYDYETLKIIQFSSDLYLAIMLPNASERETLAAQIEAWLLENKLDEFQSLEDNQHFLTPVMLVSKITNTDVFQGAINQLCKDPASELSFGSKMKLNTYNSFDDCPSAEFKQDRSALILQKALTDLEKMKSNIVNREKDND